MLSRSRNYNQQRADCENIFDELRNQNQWGHAGFCSQHSNVTKLAARLMPLSYNIRLMA